MCSYFNQNLGVKQPLPSLSVHRPCYPDFDLSGHCQVKMRPVFSHHLHISSLEHLKNINVAMHKIGKHAPKLNLELYLVHMPLFIQLSILFQHPLDKSFSQETKLRMYLVSNPTQCVCTFIWAMEFQENLLLRFTDLQKHTQLLISFNLAFKFIDSGEKGNIL